jgi:capsular polysaccharide biosynthesis protein
VTWDGAVFHNLRLFVPSIVHPRFATRFQDTLLLRQWVGERVAPQETCVAVCHDQWSVENYYHWLVDTLPRLLVLRQHHPDILLMIPQPLPPKQLPEYISRSAKAFGFESFMPVTTRQIMSAECVVLPELTAPSLTQNPELITGVRSILLKELHSGQVHPTRKVYAARALQGVRRLVNEAEVDEVLKGFGFEKIYFDRLTFLQQIALMRQTSVFLGVHGAAMANMLFLPESAKVIELLNEDSGELCYFRLASCLGLDYFYAPCKATNPELGNQSDMMASAELLEKIVSITLAR